MGAWVVYAVVAVAVLSALGVLWVKKLKPLVRSVRAAARGFALMEEALPLLTELSAGIKNAPDALKDLADIGAQLRSDSGTTLRDAVNRLEHAAAEQRAASAEQAATASLMAGGVNALLLTIRRIEQHSAEVAADLADSHKRADATTDLTPGAAADAAAQQTVKEIRNEERKEEP